MNNELKIYIKSCIDQSSGAISDINRDIAQLSEKINKLTLKVNIDDTGVKKLTEQVSNAQKSMAKSFSGSNNLNQKGLVTGIDEAIKKYEQLGQVVVNKTFNPANNELQSFIIQLTKADGIIEKIQYKAQKMDLGNGLENVFSPSKITEIDKTAEIQEQTLQKTQELRNKISKQQMDNIHQEALTENKARDEMEQAFLSTFRKREEERVKFDSAQREAIYKNSELERVEQEKLSQLESKAWVENKKFDEQKIAAREKNLQEEQRIQRAIDATVTKEKEKAAQLEHQLKLYKQQAEINAQNLTRRFGKSVDQGELDSYLQSVNMLSSATPNLNNRMKDLDMSFKKISASAKTSGSHVDGLGEMFKTAFSKMSVWLVAGNVFFGISRTIKEATATIIELDSQITHLKRVMDEETNFEDMLRGAMNIANDLGQKVTEINKSLISAAQAGFEGQKALDITRTSVIAANVSDMSPEEALSDIIAAMKSFNIEAENSISIVDKLNETDNNFSVSSRNLADSVAKAGAAAKTYGVSLDELIGYTTAIGETTRESGNIIGNSMKTIFSRLFTSDSAKAFAEVGIQTQKLNGENKTASEVISELGAKWNELTSTQQQNLGVTVAGRYQLTRFLSLFNNFDTAVKATQTSISSQGSAMVENEKYMDSLQARLNLLTTAFQEAAYNAGESGFSGVLAGSIDALTYLIKTFGNLHTILITTGVAIAAWKGKQIISTVVGITTSIKGSISSFPAYVMGLGTTRAAMDGVTVSASRTKIAMIGLGEVVKSNWVGLLLTGIMAATVAFDMYNQKQEEARRKTEEVIQKYEEESKGLEDVAGQYKKLAKSGDTSNKTKSQLKMIQDQLIKTYGLEADALDLVNGKYDEQILKLSAIGKEKAKEALRAMGSGPLKDRNLLEDSTTTKINFSVEDQQSGKIIDELSKKYENFTSKIFEGKQAFQIDGTLKERVAFMKDLVDQTGKLAQKDDKYYPLLDKVTKQYNSLNTQLQEATRNVTKYDELDFASSLGDQALAADGLVEALNKNPTDQKLIDQVKNLKTEMNGFAESQGKLENFKPFIDKIFSGSSEAKKLGGSLSYVAQSADDTGEGFEQAKNPIEGAVNGFKNASKEVGNLNQTLRELEKGQSLSGDAMAELIIQYPQLADQIKKTADGYTVETSALESLRKLKVEKAISDLENEKKSTQATLANSLKRVQAYGVEVQGIKSVEEAKARIDEINKRGQQYDEIKRKEDADKLLNKTNGSPFGLTPPPGTSILEGMLDKQEQDRREKVKSDEEFAKRELESYIKDTEQYTKQIEALQKIIADPNFGVSASALKEDKPKSESQLKDALEQQDMTKELISSFNEEYEIRKKIIASQQRQIGITEKQKDYNKAIEQTNELISEQEKAIKNLEEAQKKMSSEANNLRSSRSDLDTESWFDSNNEMSLAYKEFYNSFAEQSAKVYGDTSKSIDQRNTEIEQIKKQQKEIETLFDHLSLLKKGWQSNAEEIVSVQDAIDKSNDKIREYNEAMQKAAEEQKKAAIDANKEWMDVTKKAIDEVIDSYKEYYEKQKDIALDSVDKQVEAEEKRHKSRMDNLSDEMDKYKEIIDQINKQMDRDEDRDEFDKNLAKAQKERQDLLNEYNKRVLDTSSEGKLKASELQTQISAKDEEIEKMKTDRTKQLRKDNLSDMLDQKQKEIDAAKEAEDRQYDATKERLDALKKETTRYWENIIQDERFYNGLREQILSGHTSNLSKEMEGFKNTLGTQMSQIGESITRNLIDKLAAAQKMISGIDYNTSASNPMGMSPSDFSSYLQNKKNYESGYNQSQSAAMNASLRAKYGILNDDYTYESLKNAAGLDTGGYTGNWANGNGKLAFLHPEEIVLDKIDTKGLFKAVDVAAGFMNSIRNFDFGMLKQKVSESNPVTYNLAMNIANVTGDKKGAEFLYSNMVDGLKKLGSQI